MWCHVGPRWNGFSSAIHPTKSGTTNRTGIWMFCVIRCDCDPAHRRVFSAINAQQISPLSEIFVVIYFCSTEKKRNVDIVWFLFPSSVLFVYFLQRVMSRWCFAGGSEHFVRRFIDSLCSSDWIWTFQNIHQTVCLPDIRSPMKSFFCTKFCFTSQIPFFPIYFTGILEFSLT